MQMLHFQIEALAPLAFPERKPGVQFNKSLPYVPGAAIYGALGQQFGPECFDAELFRSLRCHNAYPCHSDDSWVRPLPITASQPKGAERDTQPIDTLIERICWERQQPAALIYAPTDADGRPWEGCGSKFYTFNRHQVAYREVQQRLLTRVAINRQRGTAQESRLYSPLAISEVNEQDTGRVPTLFLGSLIVPDKYMQDVSDTLITISHLGGRQTSGLGAVRVRLIPPSPPDEPAEIMKRVEQLTRAFQDQVQRYIDFGGTPWPIGDTTIFTVNLLADTILLEHGWLPTQIYSPIQLAADTGIQATLLRAFTTTKPIGGWHTLWQRPKQVETAVVMGGLYVFASDRPLDTHACIRLAQLQLDGIGERREEGFGQIRICDDFHM